MAGMYAWDSRAMIQIGPKTPQATAFSSNLQHHVELAVVWYNKNLGASVDTCIFYESRYTCIGIWLTLYRTTDVQYPLGQFQVARSK